MIQKMKYSYSLNGLFPLLLCAFAVVAIFAGVQPASAVDNCIQDVWKAHGNKQDLTCTANDVQLSQVTNINVSAGGYCETVEGVKTCYCYEGQDVTFTADFYMLLTAQDRFDTGFYIAIDGDTGAYGALTGECASTEINEGNSTTFFNDNDADPGDLCGDISGPAGTAINPQIVNFTVTMPCEPGPTGKLALPYCTTWRQPGSNEVCVSASPDPALNDVFPGSPSKCFCDVREIDIFTETASIEVTKTNTSGCVPETGGSVTYHVTVKNLAQVSSVTLDTFTDSLYGDITTTGHNGITATTCTLATIAAGDTYGCDFTVTAPPGNFNDIVPDTVEACGTDQFGHTNLCDDDSASYCYTDVSVPPSLLKTAVSSQVISYTVDFTYTVVVTNNSPMYPGDALYLSALNDDVYGDITSVHDNVMSTTCTALPLWIPYQNNYSCQFVGRVVSTGSVTDTVTATSVDSDGVNYSPSDDATVTVVVTPTP